MFAEHEAVSGVVCEGRDGSVAGGGVGAGEKMEGRKKGNFFSIFPITARPLLQEAGTV